MSLHTWLLVHASWLLHNPMYWFADFYVVPFTAAASPVLYFKCFSLLSVQYRASTFSQQALCPLFRAFCRILPLLVFLCKSIACRINQGICYLTIYTKGSCHTSFVSPQFRNSPRMGNQSLYGLSGQCS